MMSMAVGFGSCMLVIYPKDPAIRMKKLGRHHGLLDKLVSICGHRSVINDLGEVVTARIGPRNQC